MRGQKRHAELDKARGTRSMATMIYAEMVGMPMPRMMQTIITARSDRKMLPPASATNRAESLVPRLEAMTALMIRPAGGARQCDGGQSAYGAHKAFHDPVRRHPGAASQKADGNEQTGSDKTGHHDGFAHADIIDQQSERNHHMQIVFDGADDIRTLLLGLAFQTVSLRIEVHLAEDAEVVKERREGRGDNDMRVINVRCFGHDESCGAHDRGHELSAGGCRRGDTSRSRAVESVLLHNGYGERAYSDNVGNGASTDHAHECAGHDFGLSGAAAKAAGQPDSRINEKLSAA